MLSMLGAQPRTQPDVWRRLAALDFDVPGASLPFTTRLARDNGWTEEFAKRAIEEYRRFAYLSVVSRQPVTPSDEVDQVWHLHLCYTRHYWGPFREALGQPLHHGPTEGGKAQGQLFRQQYDATLNLYMDEFGEVPPADLWPKAAIRFGKAPSARRVLTSDHWVIRKPSRTARWIGGSILVAAAAPSLAAANAGGRGISTFISNQWSNNPPLFLFVVFGFFSLILLILTRGGKGGGKGSSSGCGAGGTSSGKGGDGGDGSDGGSGCGGSGCGGCGGG